MDLQRIKEVWPLGATAVLCVYYLVCVSLISVRMTEPFAWNAGLGWFTFHTGFIDGMSMIGPRVVLACVASLYVRKATSLVFMLSGLAILQFGVLTNSFLDQSSFDTDRYYMPSLWALGGSALTGLFLLGWGFFLAGNAQKARRLSVKLLKVLRRTGGFGMAVVAVVLAGICFLPLESYLPILMALQPESELAQYFLRMFMVFVAGASVGLAVLLIRRSMNGRWWGVAVFIGALAGLVCWMMANERLVVFISTTTSRWFDVSPMYHWGMVPLVVTALMCLWVLVAMKRLSGTR